MRLRARQAVVTEYNRTYKELNRRTQKRGQKTPTDYYWISFMQGAQQALAWALDDHAVRPTKCGPGKKSRIS